MELFTGIASILGGVYSFVQLIRNPTHRMLHAMYLVLFVVIASFYIKSESKLSRIRNTEQAAKYLIAEKDHTMGDGQFIFAALTFLEKNRSYFPDAYERAKKIFDANQSFLSPEKLDVGGYRHELSQRDVSEYMTGTLRGIAAVSEKN